MARFSTVTITNVAPSPADEYDLDIIAGIAPRDVAPFVDHVGAELAAATVSTRDGAPCIKPITYTAGPTLDAWAGRSR